MKYLDVVLAYNRMHDIHRISMGSHMLDGLPGFWQLPSTLSTNEAAQPTLNWTKFTDPAEKSVTYDVPLGWLVDGGTMRFAPTVAYPWLKAVAPSQSTQIFIADPTIPFFTVPPFNQAEGTVLPSPSAQMQPTVALYYRPGTEFAKFHGPKNLAVAGYSDFVLTGEQALPDIAQAGYARSLELVHGVQTRFPVNMPYHDAGLARFMCRNGATTLAAGVIADTAQPMSPSGFWSAQVAGYVTQPGQEDWALSVLKHVLLSRTWNPEWDQTMRAHAQEGLTNIYAENDQMSAKLLAMGQDSFKLLMANSIDFGNRLKTTHDNFMTQMADESKARSIKFAADMLRKDINSAIFTAYARS